MLTLLQNNNLKFVLTFIAVLAALLVAVPVNITTAATTRLELTNRLTKELSSSSNYNYQASNGQVLGQQTSVPFFPRGFVYPIPELGNCNNKTSCFEFCEDKKNLEICSMVSYRNGMMSASQLKKTLAFASYLSAGYFETCNNLGSCAEVCDNKDVRDDCNALALSLEQGSRVLGASDTNQSTNNFSLIEYCKNNSNCYDQSVSGNSIVAALDSLIKSGQAPKACNNAEQCQEYCSATSSIECSQMFTKLSYMSGTLAAPQPQGRVLNASTQDDYQSLAQQQDYSSAVDNYQTTYQPEGSLGCIVDRQAEPAPYPLVVTDAQQADNFVSNAQRCDQQYSTTKTQSANYASSGKTKALEGVDSVYSCILGLKSSVDIQQCLNY